MQIASALEKAHRNNIVHRDIKPHNIIITEEGVAKVTDFGIAKAVSNSTITAFGTTIGSVHYFSPEHARGGVTDAKSDLYSLGVVMYEMVTGKVPFDSDTPVSVALKHMQEEPIEPIKINPSLPKSVNDIIMKAMKKDKDQRYASATEMLKDLEQALKTPDESFVNDDTTKTIVMNVANNRSSKDEEDDEEEDKPKGKIGKYFAEHPVLKVVAIAAICILVFVLAMGGTYLALTLGKAKEVQIPDFSNMTLEEAQAKAKELKIKIEHNEEDDKYHLEIEEGKVIEQEPRYQPNFKIKEGSKVKIILSKGQEIVKVPENLEGKQRDEVLNELRETGLEVQIVEENNDKIEKDIVFKIEKEDKTALKAGDEIPAGTTVLVYVSMGIEQVEVPDLSGKSEAESKSLISTAKLKWKSTDKTSDSSKPNGVVVNQSISAGSMVDKDSEITITVNEFDELKTATITVNVKSLLGGRVEYEDEEKTKVKNVKLTIKVGGDTIYSEKVDPTSTSISTSKTDKGNKEITVYIDDIWKASKQINFNTQSSITVE